VLAGLDVERAIALGADEKTRIPTIEHEWSRVIRVLGDVHPRVVTESSLNAYVSERRKSGVSSSTIRRELRGLRRGLEIAQRNGWVIALPRFPDVGRHIPTARGRGKLHDPNILREWFLAIECDETRDEAMMALLTGMRSAEIKRLRPSWVELTPPGSSVPAMLRVPATDAKSRKERIAGLPEAVLAIVRARATEADAPIFSGADHKKERAGACRRIGYQRSITLRDLRHTHATLAAVATGDAAAVQSALGHSDLATTQRYLSTTLARTASVAAAVSLELAAVATCHIGAATPNLDTEKR
jgi:integrase